MKRVAACLVTIIVILYGVLSYHQVRKEASEEQLRKERFEHRRQLYEQYDTTDPLLRDIINKGYLD
jgi:hypothetical protein